jgi:aspartate aminotransferase
MTYISHRVKQALISSHVFFNYTRNSSYAKLSADPEVSNFVFGNPQEMPLPGFVSTLKHWLTPQDKNWFAYKDNMSSAQQAAASALQQRLGLSFMAEDIALTNGAFSAISVSLAALINPQDEVIYFSPPWFFYESLITTWGGVPVKIELKREDNFKLNLDALIEAITPRTRAVIINSPHNPTGVIYSSKELENLSLILHKAHERFHKPIYLLSDESYCKIIFDQRSCPSPSQFYDYTLVIYTYGKTLLTPGQRLGYVALAPSIPDQETLRMALAVASLNAGYAYPNALMQYALPDLEKLSIDIIKLQKRRDILVSSLRSYGYETNNPDSTFYLMVRSPIPHDEEFCERLALHNILCLPGTMVELPGYFRISMTATDTMVQKALPGFKKVILAST